MAELTAEGEAYAVLTATLIDQPLTASGGTYAILSAYTDLMPDLPLKATAVDSITVEVSPVLAGEIVAEAADSIAVPSERKPWLPIADIIDAIRTLLDEMAHAISFYALTIATVYSANRILTVILPYACGRRTRGMPMGRLACRLFDRLISV